MKKSENKENRKSIIIVLIIIIAAVQVYLLNSLSTYGSKLNKLENDIRAVSQQNDDLEEAIASASSLTTLSGKAKSLGLAVNPPILSLNGPVPVAFNPSN